MKAGIYRHFKGKLYQLIDVAKHSETDEDYVVYRALYAEQGAWIRPYAKFNETLEKNGKIIRRFEWIADDLEQAEAIIEKEKEKEKVNRT